ncbi:MAG: NAD-dependent epimerase/dehydratase family protein [Alphaproteobacteria bacterium]
MTGASGFVGGHIAHELIAQGWRVSALVRRRDATLPGGVVPVSGDLEDSSSLIELVTGADAVIHCAGVVGAVDRAGFQAVNVGGTARLATAATGLERPPRFIQMSSLAAREPALSAYGASKRDGEQALLHHGERLDWTILRPAAVYGPGDRATLAFFKQWQSGFMVVPAGGGQRLSLIHGADLAAAVVALLASGAGVGVTFEVGDRHPVGYSWREVAAAGGRALGRRVTCVPVPRAVLMAAAAASAAAHGLIGRTPMVTPGKVRELYHPDWVCDGHALAAATGWSPTATMEEGIITTAAWYREQGWL